MKVIRGAVLALAAFPAFTLCLPAQTPRPAQEPPTIKVTTEEVILDVIVRDKKGKPVKDLTPEEVEVTDNGVKQKVTGFRLVEGREAIEKGARVPLDAMKQIRLVTLVFEPL
ncbi:MAG: hypothetical protein IT161_06840, partial [Bryobacterales bacterium]|nr:hypothetical protein [Bryobacterales bacterium]